MHASFSPPFLKCININACLFLDVYVCMYVTMGEDKPCSMYWIIKLMCSHTLFVFHFIARTTKNHNLDWSNSGGMNNLFFLGRKESIFLVPLHPNLVLQFSRVQPNKVLIMQTNKISNLSLCIVKHILECTQSDFYHLAQKLHKQYLCCKTLQVAAQSFSY